VSAPGKNDIWLDYAGAGRKAKFLPNLSAVAVAGDYLWTVSDEMRTVECLAPWRNGYRLHRQFELEGLFPGLPGAQNQNEADIEAIDVANGRLWLCGSHSLTRRSQGEGAKAIVDPKIRKRPSRRLFGAVPLAKDGSSVTGPGQALPFDGAGSLRTALGGHAHLAPFLDLPSKENGLDIEGLTIRSNRAFIGLRGPVVDNIAIIAAMKLGADFSIDDAGLFLHFVDLGGLGVRDLTRWQNGILILAGPVNGADGPFQLNYWRPIRTGKIQRPQKLKSFPQGEDHPEGMCVLQRRKANGLIVVYDTKAKQRLSGTRYRAEWIKI
jgi:hypothetical protein